MEFTNKSNYESDTPNSGAEKKSKKKSPKKRIIAPVPIESINAQELHSVEKASKKKERKKASKKAEKTTETPPVEKPARTAKKGENIPKKGKESSGEENVGAGEKSAVEEATATSEAVSESTVSEHLEATHEDSEEFSPEQVHINADDAEVVVSLNEAADEEGTIFVSERLRQHEGIDEEVEEKASRTTAARRKSATTTATGVAAGATVAATQGSSVGRHSAARSRPAGTSPSTSTSSSSRSASRGGAVPPRPVATSESRRSGSSPFSWFNANTAPKSSAERKERYGFVGGVLLGGIIEHIRHKRREKQTEKQSTKEVKATRKENTENTEKLANQSKREKTTLEKQIERLSTEVKKAKSEVNEKKQQVKELERPPKNKRVVEQKQVLTADKPEAAPVVRTARQEAPVKQVAKQAEAASKKPVAEVQPPASEEEGLAIPANHKIEQSAWHSIEVDRKTGKAVENPSFEYGEEFKNEQHQEMLRKQIADMSMESDRVRENYLFKTAPKQAKSDKSQPVPSSQNPLASQVKPPMPQATKPKPITAVATQKAQQKITNTEPVDIVLWVVLFFVIGIIIVIL